MPLESSDVPGNVPTPERPPDSEQSGQQSDPDGTTKQGETDESKELPNPKQ